MIDSSSKIPESDLSETVVFDVEYAQLNFSSDIGFSLESEVIWDFAESHGFNDFIEKFGMIINNGIPWDIFQSINSKKLIISRDQMLPFEKSSYVSSYALVVIDDLGQFLKNLLTFSKRDDGQHLSSFHRYSNYIEIQLNYPLSQIPVPYLEIQRTPLTIYVVGSDVYLNPKKKIPPGIMSDIQSGIASAIQHKSELIHINRMHLIDRSITAIDATCTDILEGIPRESIRSDSDRDERISNFIQAWEKLSIYTNAYLLSRDFVIREEPFVVPESHFDKKYQKTSIEARLDVLGKRLDLLEKSIQTQLNYDQGEKRARSETRFNKISVVLAALVLFEVISSYYSWKFPQDSIYGEISWIFLIALMTYAIIWALANIVLNMTIVEALGLVSKEGNKVVQTAITWVRHICPNCNAR